MARLPSADGACRIRSAYGLMQSLNAQGLSSGEGYPQPSRITGGRDIFEDTTANLYSYLVMQRYITPDQLVSPADFVTDPDQDYDWTLYNPRERVYWDPSFSADLSEVSNVSYAHALLQRSAEAELGFRNGTSKFIPGLRESWSARRCGD